MSSAARSRRSMAECPAVARLTSTAPGISDAILRGHRRRGDQIAATGDDDCRPAELGHLIDEIERLGNVIRFIRCGLAQRQCGIEWLSVGHRTVVQFAIADPLNQVGLVTIWRLALEQQPGRRGRRATTASRGPASSRSSWRREHRRAPPARTYAAASCVAVGREYTVRRPAGELWSPAQLFRARRRRHSSTTGRFAHGVDVFGRQQR